MKLGFALEYSLGHVTHAANLKAVLAQRPHLVPRYVDLPYADMSAPWARLPGVRSNWSLRASLGAYLGLRRDAPHCGGLLFHTQVTSLLSAGLMERTPSVVSLDATPLQYDALGAFYGHAAGSGKVEALKKRLNLRAFGAARALVTWSEWAKRSLVEDYGVDAGKVEVIPPGIDIAAWNFGERPVKDTVEFLFVGGDFPRKGGDTLLEAWRRLEPGIRSRCRLHIVTKTEGVGEGVDGVEVHTGVSPNSERLLALYRRADAFVFPTRGDCLPLAVLEALASGLPVITTAVAALPEAVVDNVSGRIVPVDDAGALAAAMGELAGDAGLRRRLGAAAREEASLRFDARTNYGRLVDVVAGATPVALRRAA
ncbi:MAG: glycosyltransferase family 4 protein [Armatimonadota bacterium]